jgi:acyl-CoA reductase-like NAD-dependent aldehyde dehydrogenase
VLQMELGGKDVCIVCEDADLDLAAKNIVKGGFSYSGQRCTAVKIVLALEGIADELVAKVKKGVDALSVGAPEVRTPRCRCWQSCQSSSCSSKTSLEGKMDMGRS